MIEKYPFISVIIPTYNRPEQLFSCLQSFERQDYPPDRFEIIVVDDGGKMSLETVTGRFKDEIDLKLFKQANAGPAKSRNAGAGHAKGQILAFTDDDCIPAEGWLANIAERFSCSTDFAIGGPSINSLTNNLFSCTSQLINDFLLSYYKKNDGEVGFFPSNNLAVLKDRFHAIGEFDVRFPLAGGEDREFCERWSNHGYTLIYDPEIRIYHAHHLNFFTFLRQHFNYGRGSFTFHKLSARRNNRLNHLRGLPFYLKLLSYPSSEARGLRMIKLSTLVFLSQVAIGAGFLVEGIKSNSIRNGTN